MITRNLMQQRGGLGPRAQGILEGVGELTMQGQSQAMPAQIVSQAQRPNETAMQPRSVMTLQGAPNVIASTSTPPNMLPKMQAAAKMKQMVDENPAIEQDPTFQDRAKRFFGNRENMYRLAMAFNTMRFQPDQGLATFLGEELKYIRGKEQQNATLSYLDKVRPDVAKLVRGGMPIKDALELIKGGSPLSTAGKLAADLNAGRITKAQYDAEVARLAKAGTTTINMTGQKKGDEALYKGSADLIVEDAGALAGLIEQRSNIELLSRLGNIVDSEVTMIPAAMRKFVPQGVSGPIDAYRSVLDTAAQSLRVKGSGDQTDKDFEIMQNRAGSISADPTARKIAQAALMRGAEIKIARSRAAQTYLRNIDAKGARERYYAELDRINAEPMLSEDQRIYLLGLGENISTIDPDPSFTPQQLAFFKALRPENQEKFNKMTPEQRVRAMQQGEPQQ